MKVLYANNYLTVRGGAEQVMFAERNFFRNSGFEVRTFGRYEPGAQTEENLECLPPVASLANRSVIESLTTVPNIIYNWSARRLFGAMLDRHRFDIVHGHNIYSGLTTSIIDECRRRDIPFLLTLHDYKLMCPSYLMLRRGMPCSRCVEGSYMNCLTNRCHKGSFAASAIVTMEAYFHSIFHKWDGAARLICPSKFVMSEMVRNGTHPSRLAHVPNGLDTHAFEPSYDDAGYFAYVGRLSSEKGIETLLRACARCPWTLAVIGDGPDREKLERLAEDLKVKAIFHGHKSGDELAELMRNAAFIVTPSEWFENAPMSILEAMAYGKPVIASDIGGIPELVIRNETGVLFHAGDCEQLEQAIASMISSPEKRREMGQAARRLVTREFSIEAHCSRLRVLYEELCTTSL